MNSVTKNKLLNLAEDARSLLTPRFAIVVGLVLLVVIGYHAGKRSAQHVQTDQEWGAQWNRWADSVQKIHDTAKQDSLAFVSAVGQANKSRASYAKVASRIVVVNKDAVSIDNGPATPEVAASIVEQIIASANDALTKDSTVHVANVALTNDLRAQVAVLEQQKTLAVAEVEAVRPKWYTGWKAGSILTALAVVGLKLLLK